MQHVVFRVRIGYNASEISKLPSLTSLLIENYIPAGGCALFKQLSNGCALVAFVTIERWGGFIICGISTGEPIYMFDVLYRR